MKSWCFPNFSNQIAPDYILEYSFSKFPGGTCPRNPFVSRAFGTRPCCYRANYTYSHLSVMPQQGQIPGAAPARCGFPKKNAPLQGIEIKFHSAQMTKNSSHLNNSSRRWQGLPSIHWSSFLWWLKSQWPRSPQAPKHCHPPSHHMRIRKNQCKGQRSGWAALGFLEEEKNKRIGITASEHKLLRLWRQEPIINRFLVTCMIRSWSKEATHS